MAGCHTQHRQGNDGRIVVGILSVSFTNGKESEFTPTITVESLLFPVPWGTFVASTSRDSTIGYCRFPLHCLLCSIVRNK